MNSRPLLVGFALAAAACAPPRPPAFALRPFTLYTGTLTQTLLLGSGRTLESKSGSKTDVLFSVVHGANASAEAWFLECRLPLSFARSETAIVDPGTTCAIDIGGFRTQVTFGGGVAQSDASGESLRLALVGARVDDASPYALTFVGRFKPLTP